MRTPEEWELPITAWCQTLAQYQTAAERADLPRNPTVRRPQQPHKPRAQTTFLAKTQGSDDED